MIQPIKQFRVTRLTISGFKGYADQKTFQFGGMNVISGHMGVGKSSIADAIAFAITGVGFYAGAKIDYLYHQDTRDLLVELEFEDEPGKLRTLARHRKDDKMDITLDGVRIGQGDLTTMFGERDLFLSMFNPQYFINVLGSKGRNLLERYLPEVPKAEVLAQLSDQTRALLEKQEFLSAEAYHPFLLLNSCAFCQEGLPATNTCDCFFYQRTCRISELMLLLVISLDNK